MYRKQIFSVRKRSDSNKYFLCESEATATNVFCAKAKRQIQKSPTSISGGMNARKVMESEGVPNYLLIQVKPPTQLRLGIIDFNDLSLGCDGKIALCNSCD
ncbi:hypothetical protein, partial [Metasolibacillus meyeri]|uniref:hypothetical protein n=1 Tax=Metasolibacillus meyeri TaxID=1071052 RepID=UPI001EE72001